VRVDVTVRCFGTNGTPLVTEPGQTVVAGRILSDLQVAPVANVHLLVIPSAPNALYAWASLVENNSSDQMFIRPHVLP
jgi:hypothetical protein